jgi:hypothetical protein
MSQIKTHGTTIGAIMSSRGFREGVDDYRAGRRYPEFLPDAFDDWSYDRGRLWAAVAPRNMPVMVNGKLNPAALCVGVRNCKDIFDL